MSKETDPTVTSFVLPGLDKGTSYTVSVAAINEAGMGPFSMEVTAETAIHRKSGGGGGGGGTDLNFKRIL